MSIRIYKKIHLQHKKKKTLSKYQLFDNVFDHTQFDCTEN